MVVKMFRNQIIFFGMAVLYVLSLASCRNLFSKPESESPLVEVRGTISTPVIAVPDTAISSNRYAIPQTPSTGINQNLWYTVTAYMGTKSIEGEVYGSNSDNFHISLPQGNWIIVVRGYNSETTHNASTQILEGKSDTLVINKNSTYYQDVRITAEPIFSGNGSVLLDVRVPLTINTVIASWKQNVNGTETTLKQVLVRGDSSDSGDFYMYNAAHITLKDTPESGGTSVNNSTNAAGDTLVPAGIYDVRIDLYEQTSTNITTSTQPVYSILSEIVYIYKNMQSTQWRNQNNAIDISEAAINYNKTHTFYVKPSAADGGDGSSLAPYNDLQTAIDRVITVNDGGNYTIALFEDITVAESVSSFSTTAPEHGTYLKITTTETALNLKITSDNPAQKRTIDVNRTSSRTGGIFYLNGNAANLNLTLENLVLKGAYSEKTGGVLGMENGTATAANGPTFTGARVTVKNCEFCDNMTISDSGGAVFIAKHNSFKAYNSVFRNNGTYHSDDHYNNKFGNAGAIYAYGSMEIDTCIFEGNRTNNISTASDNATENNAAGGAILINLHGETTDDNQNVIIKHSTFINNVAKGAGGAIQINTPKVRNDGTEFPIVQFWNVTVKNNQSLATNFAGGIGICTDGGTTYQPSFSIKGVNIITENTRSDGTPCNVYLPAGKMLYIKASTVPGPIGGSRIGITKTDSSTIGTGDPLITYLPFTIFYRVSVDGNNQYSDPNPLDPSEIFFCDNDDYVVDSSTVAITYVDPETSQNKSRYEAKIIQNKYQAGDSGNNLAPDYNTSDFSIDINRNRITGGKHETIKVSVEKNYLPMSGDNVEMTYTLSCYGGKIEPESSSPTRFALDSSDPFKLHFYDGLPEGTYELLVQAYDKQNGCTNSASFIINNTAAPMALSDALNDSSITLAAGQSYSIKSQADFLALANKVSDSTDSFDFAGVTLYMENDVEFTGNVTIIGTDTKPFKGIFDGQRYSIIYGNENGEATFSASNSALFAYVSSSTSYSAAIKNVTAKLGIEQTLLTNASSGLVSTATGTADKPVIIKNCKNEVKLSWSEDTAIKVAGIVKEIENGIIADCQNSGDIELSMTTNPERSAGGIAGTANSCIVRNCLNSGKITSSQNGQWSMGGICGTGIGCTFYNLKNTGEIYSSSSSSTKVGGILGGIKENYPVTVFNCENSASIRTTSAGSAGGIIGYDYVENENVKICNCNNTGMAKSGSGKDYCSGIVGRNTKIGTGFTLDLKNLMNTGVVESATNTPTEGHPILYIGTSYASLINYENNYYESGKGKTNTNANIVTQVSAAADAYPSLNIWVEQQNATQSDVTYAGWKLEDNVPHLDLYLQ